MKRLLAILLFFVGISTGFASQEVQAYDPATERFYIGSSGYEMNVDQITVEASFEEFSSYIQELEQQFDDTYQMRGDIYEYLIGKNNDFVHFGQLSIVGDGMITEEQLYYLQADQYGVTEVEPGSHGIRNFFYRTDDNFYLFKFLSNRDDAQLTHVQAIVFDVQPAAVYKDFIKMTEQANH